MRHKIVLILISALCFTACTPKIVTLERLLEEMVNREVLAQFPEPPFTLAQFSSYDRATVAPGEPSWFANWDRTMFIRTDTIDGRLEYVMFDADGPGAIVRFWMTFAGENSGHGTMRIYFDNQPQPTIEGTAFDILSGGKLTGEPLSSSVSDSTSYEMRGHNLYLHLPYARHCKITYQSENIKDAGAKTGGEAVYYNINYRTYAKGTKVETFTKEVLKNAAGTLEKAQTLLANRDRGLDQLKTEKTRLEGNIEPGASLVAQINGNKAVRALKMKVSPDINPQALRTTIIEMSFDGQRTVWCPVGDFFGTGYQLRYSNTWYTSVDPNGTLSAYWVMPFNKGTEIKIHNIGLEKVEIGAVEIIYAPWKWNKRSMHFGTSWHQFTHLHTGEMKNNEGKGDPFDINYVTLTGKGVYVGDAVTLFNTVYAWWGEGDEKIYVDGESFPSHIGTGTEDYYGYAWCRPEKFSNHPYIAQPDGSGNFWPGYTVNIRHRALDGIPFNRSLQVDMEMWHWTRATINFAPVTFWYVMPNGKANIEPDIEGAKAKVALKRTDIISPYIQNNRMEAESMVLIENTGGNFRYQNSIERGWSDNMQVFWSNGNPGDKLKLAFFSESEAIVEVTGHFTLAPDYGTFSLKINGKPASTGLNLYSENLTTKEISLGKHQLLKGENTVEVTIKRPSPDPQKAFFGFDYLDFR